MGRGTYHALFRWQRRAPKALNGVGERGKLDRPRMLHPPLVRRIFRSHFPLRDAELANDGISQGEVPLTDLGDDDGYGVMQGVEALPFAIDPVEGWQGLLHQASSHFEVERRSLAAAMKCPNRQEPAGASTPNQTGANPARVTLPKHS
jgi:hypothetical protein